MFLCKLLFFWKVKCFSVLCGRKDILWKCIFCVHLSRWKTSNTKVIMAELAQGRDICWMGRQCMGLPSFAQSLFWTLSALDCHKAGCSENGKTSTCWFWNCHLNKLYSRYYRLINMTRCHYIFEEVTALCGKRSILIR